MAIKSYNLIMKNYLTYTLSLGDRVGGGGGGMEGWMEGVDGSGVYI